MTPKDIARSCDEFLKTEFGEHYITQLSLIYNGLHHEAEAETGIEHKAMKVERAAGLKIAIDFLTERQKRHTDGFFDKE